MTQRLRSLALLITVLAVGACASRADPGPTVGGADEPATVRVDNQAFADMTIYVVAGGQQIRLGTVTGKTAQTLRLNPAVVGLGRELSFRADPVGSNAVASSFSIYVAPGEQVNLVIPPTAG